MSQSGTHSGQNEPGEGSDVDRSFVRRLLTTAAGSDETAVGKLIEQLSDQKKTLDQVLRTVLTDPARLAALRDSGLLAGTPNEVFDRIARLVTEALGTPNAAVSVVDGDRQNLVGCAVIDEDLQRTGPLAESICKFAVAGGESLVVDDATTHPLLTNHPKVRDGTVRAYAGVLLVDAKNHAVATLCTWDDRPRRWTSGQIQILHDLAAMVRSKIFPDLPVESRDRPSKSRFSMLRRRS